MRTTYQDAEAVRSDYAEGFVPARPHDFTDDEVVRLAVDYIDAVSRLERLHELAIQALGRGTDVSPSAVLAVTEP